MVAVRMILVSTAFMKLLSGESLSARVDWPLFAQIPELLKGRPPIRDGISQRLHHHSNATLIRKLQWLV